MTEKELELSEETKLQKEINQEMVNLEELRWGVMKQEAHIQDLVAQKSAAQAKRFEEQADLALKEARERQARGEILGPGKIPFLGKK